MKKAFLLIVCAASAVACGGSNDDGTSGGAGAGAGLSPGGPVTNASLGGSTGTVGSSGAGAAQANTPQNNSPAPTTKPNTGTTMPQPVSGSGGSAQMPTTSAGTAGVPSTTPGGASGAGATVTPDPPGTVTLKMDSFMLQPNQEIYKCQNFDNPFGNQETAVNRLVTDMAPGSHHLHVYHQTTSATRTLEDCTIADFHPLMFAASMPHTEVQYDPGMAVKVLANSGLRIQVHYLNTKNEALMVSATLKLTPVDASTVTKWVSELYFTRADVQVPPGMQTVTTTCTVPNTYGTIGIVGSGAHMHSRGTHFVAKTSTGTTLIETDDWESAGTKNDPNVMLKPGDSITWTCTYNNDTGGTLVFGESASKNEMCIYLARFYSAPDQAQLECQAQADTGNYTMVRQY